MSQYFLFTRTLSALAHQSICLEASEATKVPKIVKYLPHDKQHYGIETLQRLTDTPIIASPTMPITRRQLPPNIIALSVEPSNQQNSLPCSACNEACGGCERVAEVHDGFAHSITCNYAAIRSDNHSCDAPSFPLACNDHHHERG